MKKLAFVFVVLGSGLAALGLSDWLQLFCWHRWASPDWIVFNRFQITIGVMLLVCGLMLRSDSR